MPSFKKRSYVKELLDRNDIPFPDIRRNMEELDTINTYLGGHSITLKGLKFFVPSHTDKVLNIVEIGCGGGDNLRVIKKWAEKEKQKVQLTGLDINPECIHFASTRKENDGIRFIHSDYRLMPHSDQPHIIFSSLFCHHFTNKEIVLMLCWMKERALQGFFINDLHRHPLAWHSIRFLTKVFSKSYLVKNDAPLSVLRGFTREEWEGLFSAAGIQQYTLRWQWAFRWLITCRCT